MSLFQALSDVMTSPASVAATWGAAASFIVCIVLVMTPHLHGKLSMDHTHGIQKFHIGQTPRIGGIAIFVGFMVAWGKAPSDVRAMLQPILLASLPAFLFGLGEDLLKRISVLSRLLATMASGVLAWWLTDYSLSRLDIWGVDWALKFTLVSVLFTAFAVGGVANSVNIIDGFNGLASLMSGLAFMGYALVAWQVGDTTLAQVALVLGCCVWGFFWVNWPLGKIFLGDGGSYLLGFAVAWVGVLLVERNPTVSAFTALVICAHPVTEVLYSIYRRKVKKSHLGMPDRLHFHSLVKRRYVSRWFRVFPRMLRNSITGALVGMMTLTAVVLANLTYHSTAWSVTAYVALALGYVAIYARMVQHRWCSPIRFLLVKVR
ncbi:MAG: glycosyl transferase [Limnohabitans sp.]|uniref:MraY family glycosyltransferase n=1 Tax=Rhodoferax sp. TaxID=50421 RepID=UPI0011D4BA74|nr:glycosyltransferase [Rhodoferax sp.]MBE0475050.1 glycosyltransferase family 4 protein [Rhodoferax sp.]TXI71904.1 MAG: glycosyl transferase [Limnohabitans sp.]